MTDATQHHDPSPTGATPTPGSLPPELAGREYWRSVEHLAGSAELQEAMTREFPGYDPEHIRSVSRRGFMKLMGASMALAGLTLSGCRRWPKEQLMPYAARPEYADPGIPIHYATTFKLGGYAIGVLAESFDGRPIKIEGNPDHPTSLGATDVFAQASVLDLYDADRGFPVTRNQEGRTQVSSWDAFTRFARPLFSRFAETGGEGLAILAEPDDGPSYRRLRDELVFRRFPRAKFVQWSPVRHTPTLPQGGLRPDWMLERARVIGAFGGDWFGTHPLRLVLSRGWARGRRSADDASDRWMNRMYLAEAAFTSAGSVADHRLGVRPSELEPLLYALGAELGLDVRGLDVEAMPATQRKWVATLASDLREAGAEGVVMVGPELSAEAQRLGMAINQQLGAVDRTVRYIADAARPVDAVGFEGEARDRALNSAGDAVVELAGAIRNGEVNTLVVLGGNPAYDAPVDARLAAAIAAAPVSISLTATRNETARFCQWNLPEAHYLESWGDGVSWDGRFSVQQPLILPLFQQSGQAASHRTPIELLSLMLGRTAAGYDIVRDTFAGLWGVRPDTTAFQRRWEALLYTGVAGDVSLRPASAAAARVDVTAPFPLAQPPAPTASSRLEVALIPDAKVYDGRFANNGWLQETPDALSKLTWDNALYVSPDQADAMGVKQGDLVQLTPAGPSAGIDSPIEVAVAVLPGLARGAAQLALGYGRSTGRIGAGQGFNAYPLRASGQLHHATVEVTPLGRTYPLASTQDHFLLDEVGEWGVEKRVGKVGGSGYIVREAFFDEFRKDPSIFHRDAHGDLRLQLFEPPHDFIEPNHAWGMTIDLNTCIGCNACVVACQAENNVPIVGKTQVMASREMHWLRVDRYFKGDTNQPEVVHQPLMCVHCENAPCEQVCPVAATVHDTEGLNTMVYNRCIGTRYCSNNCPYKVRRFNYFDWHSKPATAATAEPWLGIPDQQQHIQVEPLPRLQFNPDVTVRMRGVMEKCTFCTQRIQASKILAKVEHAAGDRVTEQVQDGEIQTACEAACPTGAILFGNLQDKDSRIRAMHNPNRQPRAYELLKELNTRPRGKHLAKLRNPAEGLKKSGAGPGSPDVHAAAPDDSQTNSGRGS